MKMGEMYMNRVDHKNNYVTLNNNIYYCTNKWGFPRSTLSICFPVAYVPQTAGLLYTVITAVIFCFFFQKKNLFLKYKLYLKFVENDLKLLHCCHVLILCCVFHVACIVAYVVT